MPSESGQANLRSRVVSPAELKEHEKQKWRQLSRADPRLASPFLSFSFVRAAAEAGRDVRVCLLYSGDRLEGFFPFQYRGLGGRFLGAAERVGGELADYFGLVAEPTVWVSPSHLLELAGLSHFLFTHLDESQLDYGLTGDQTEVGTRLDLEDPARYWEGLRGRKKKFVKDTERRERQIAERVGPLEFKLEVQPASGSLPELVERKRNQYQRSGKRDALAQGWKRELLEILSTYDREDCRGVLSELYAGDNWLASHFGLVGNGVLQYWFPVYNSEFHKFAPGRLLLFQVIRQAARLGIHCIDRGSGTSAAKQDVATDEHLFYRGLWRRHSLGGATFHAYQAMQWRLDRIR